MKANIASIKRFAVHDGELSAPVDAAIVATNMLLEVHNIDAGACWVMHFDPNAMREKFNIPSNIKPIALLVMGYPAEDAAPLELHKKYRPINEIVFYDSFFDIIRILY